MQLPQIDFSARKDLHTVIAGGRTVYQGHPTTVQAPDGTIFCVGTIRHGGSCGPLAKSADGGRSWETVPTPENWREHVNCPTIWNLDGKLFVYAQEPESRIMVYSISEDGGSVWTPMRRCGGNIVSVMPWTTILTDRRGRFVAMTNTRDPENRDRDCNRIVRSYSTDGMNWSAPEAVTHLPEAKLCEPWLIPSPDGSVWACLMRANNRRYSSMVMFSENCGETWSSLLDFPLPGGYRPVAGLLNDGRILITYRFCQGGRRAIGANTQNLFAALTTRDDLLEEQRSQTSVNILPVDHDRSVHADTGYSGWVQFPDGEIYIVNYIVDDAGDRAQIRGYSLFPDEIVLSPQPPQPEISRNSAQP